MSPIVSTFQEFFTRLIQRGLESFGLYYSIYRGEVVSNEDPEKLGRLKISVPQVYGKEVPDYWAYPSGMAAVGVNSGLFDMPSAGDPVYLQYEMGRPSKPIWSPGWWGMKDGENEVPWNARHNPPLVATWRRKSGHRIEFDDRDGHERVLVIAKDGSYLDIDVQRKKIGIRAKSDRHDQTDGDKICYTEGSSGEYVGGDKSKIIEGSEIASIGGDKSEAISGNHARSVGGDLGDTISGNYAVSIGGNKSESITGNSISEITGNKSNAITGNKDDSITGIWTVESMMGVNVTASMGDIKLYSPMGTVWIKGLMVKINDPSFIPPMPIMPTMADIPAEPEDAEAEAPLHEEEV